jgi:hypothetical protein
MVYRRRNQILRNQNELDAPYYLYGNRGQSISPGVQLNTVGVYSIATTINELNHGSVNFNIVS